ncbi:hypothetical protein SAMN07250955_10665 [Arboricoccus pini]|uniref:Uncharacterized protein n=1 Tax=Arboricoccus pini TaxID=1963835 RepID=A0A212R6L1_9PROT|nr:hypothetical protein SAMN07250955_10665 [Arboricoccus pini]
MMMSLQMDVSFMRFTDLAPQPFAALHLLQVIAAFSILSFWIGAPLYVALLVAPLAGLFPLTGPILGLSCGLMAWSWL